MFSSATFAFLSDLRAHNEKPWFEANRDRWERDAKGPALDFVRAFAPHLATISPHFVADDRPVGGSLFRLFRDTRFSKDKAPYKTYLGIQFRHSAVRGKMGEVVHAPGFYLHISPAGTGEMDGSFGGFGMWQPEGDALADIRRRIVEDPASWAAARGDLKLEGDQLKRVPAGFPADHPLAEDLRRKDFFASAAFPEADVAAPDFAARYAEACRQGAPLMRWLCETVKLPW